jgi:hypothetical protein
LIDSGKWNAAFELTNCSKTAFNIDNTVFWETYHKDDLGQRMKKIFD